MALSMFTWAFFRVGFITSDRAGRCGHGELFALVGVTFAHLSPVKERKKYWVGLVWIDLHVKKQLSHEKELTTCNEKKEQRGCGLSVGVCGENGNQ